VELLVRARRYRWSSSPPAGACSGRRPLFFWDKVPILTGSPTMCVAPAHPFAQQDRPNLGAFHLDTSLLGGLSQGIEAPLCRAFLLSRSQLIGVPLQAPRRRLSDQRDQPAALALRQPAGSSTARAITQPLNALCIKAVQAASHGLSAAVQLLGNRLHQLSIPTECSHTRMHNPIGWPMSACCQLPDLALFLFILSSSRSQDLWHLLSPFSLWVVSFPILSLLNEQSIIAES
jgi:hypothetical protein